MGMMFSGFGQRPFNPLDPGSGVSSPPLIETGMTPPLVPDVGATQTYGLGQTAPAPTKKPSFFGRGGLGVSLLGGFGDSLREINGQAPVFAPVMEQRRQDSLVFAKQAQQQAAEYQRQVQLARYKAAHPEDDDFTRTLRAAGIDPASPEGQRQYRLKVQNQVDPVHAYPTTDSNGNEGLVFKRPSEMGGVTGTPAVQIKDAAGYSDLPPGTPYIDPNGQHRVKGGAAPATGPAGFPLYPAGHGRSGAR